MKKILFISTRYPLPVLGGDKIRAVGILKFLSKKNKIDLVCLTNKGQIQTKHPKICNSIKIFKISLIKRCIYTILSFLKGEPLQVGFYYSREMQNHLNNIHSDYHTIIFHTLRSCQYLPKNFNGKKILEMTDLLSLRYQQTFQQLSKFNLIKYIYLLEKYLVQKYEKKNIKFFDKIIFVSKEDIKKTPTKFPKAKLLFIHNGSYIKKNLFKFNKKNVKILFVGNIKYPPNKYACYDFSKNILPKLNDLYPEIKFHIVGEINFFDKFYLKKNQNVVVHGPIKNIDNMAKNNICGVCNLNIATGFQNKIANYMSYGIPTISSLISFKGLDFKQNKEILIYKTKKELIKKIIELKKNQNKANRLSYFAHKAIKNRYNWNKVLSKYSKIV